MKNVCVRLPLTPNPFEKKRRAKSQSNIHIDRRQTEALQMHNLANNANSINLTFPFDSVFICIMNHSWHSCRIIIIYCIFLLTIRIRLRAVHNFLLHKCTRRVQHQKQFAFWMNVYNCTFFLNYSRSMKHAQLFAAFSPTQTQKIFTHKPPPNSHHCACSASVFVCLCVCAVSMGSNE